MIFDKTPERIDRFRPNPFIDGPVDYLVKSVATLIAETKEFKFVFGDSVDVYRRIDYSIRQLPALRVYNLSWVKESESWFINGDLLVDVIWPANIRRQQEQDLQDLISSALCQQFRNMDFFVAVNNQVPGLNELGKVFSVNKSLGFEWESGGPETEPVVPLTQMTVNFRIDLRIWDEYLVQTYRTKESPFDKILKDLDSIQTIIQGMREGQQAPEVTITQDNNLGGE